MIQVVKPKYCWFKESERPVISQQSNPVFPDYKERVESFWNSLPSNVMKPVAVSDNELLSSDEIKNFKHDVKPVWFSRLSVDLINNGDIFGRKCSITSFSFYNCEYADYDLQLDTPEGRVFLSHDNVSDEFVIQGPN